MVGKEPRERRNRKSEDSDPMSMMFDPVKTPHIRDQTIPLLEQLDDPSGKVRSKACNLLALGAYDPGTVAMIIENNGIQKILQKVSDSCYPVVANALSTLRNLVLTNDKRVINVLSLPNYLSLYLQPYRNSIDLLKNHSERETGTKIIYHTLGLFWNLSIEKVQVIEFIEQNNLVIEFSRFLNINDYPTQLSTEAAHLIAAVTDEYSSIIDIVRGNNEITSLLTKLAQVKVNESSSCMPVLPVLCSAILFNIREQESPAKVLPYVLPSIGYVLCETNPNESILVAVSKLQNAEEFEEKQTEFKVFLEYVKNLVEAQIAALELLSNICAVDDWDNDLSMDTELSRTIPPELKEFCQKVSIPTLLEMSLSSQTDIIKKITENPSIFSELVDLLNTRTIRTFTCISNIFSVIPPSEMNVPPNIIWNQLGQLFQQFSTNPEDIPAIGGIISSMRGLLCSCEDISFIQQNDVNGISELCKNILSSEIRQNGISMLVHITSHTPVQKSKELYENTGNILKSKLGDESLIVINEALNGIFDVFGEDETFPIANAIQIGSTLQSFLPVLETRISQQQNTIGEELVDMLGDTLENTKQFIEYQLSMK